MEQAADYYYYQEQQAYDPVDEAALDRGGLVHGTHQVSQSSSFVSRSAARELPWSRDRDRDWAQPGPGAYTPRMSSPRRRIAPSAAFASTTRRFAAEKNITGTTSQSGACIDGGMGSRRGDRPGSGRSSAVFASATARFEAEPNRPPELGQFDPAAVVELRRTAPGRSAHGNPASSMASTSDRRLPFEQVSISPSPASYSPRRSEDQKPSRSSRLDLTAPRFRTEDHHASTPGPAAYSPMQAGLSRPAAPERSSAAFASRTERFASPRRSEAPTPGPGAYGGRRAAPLRRSASFGSSRRFQDATKDVPGPADYHPSADYHNGTPRLFAHSHGVESMHGTSANPNPNPNPNPTLTRP